MSPQVAVRPAVDQDGPWIHEKYDSIRFVRSDLERDHVVIVELDGERVALGRLVPRKGDGEGSGEGPSWEASTWLTRAACRVPRARARARHRRFPGRSLRLVHARVLPAVRTSRVVLRGVRIPRGRSHGSGDPLRSAQQVRMVLGDLRTEDVDARAGANSDRRLAIRFQQGACACFGVLDLGERAEDLLQRSVPACGGP